MQTIFELDTRETIKLVEDSRAKRKICGLCVFVLMRSTTTTPSPLHEASITFFNPARRLILNANEQQRLITNNTRFFKCLLTIKFDLHHPIGWDSFVSKPKVISKIKTHWKLLEVLNYIWNYLRNNQLLMDVSERDKPLCTICKQIIDACI